MDISTASSDVVRRSIFAGVDIWYDILIYAGAIPVIRMRQVRTAICIMTGILLTYPNFFQKDVHVLRQSFKTPCPLGWIPSPLLSIPLHPMGDIRLGEH